jgi:hypothetical protein
MIKPLDPGLNGTPVMMLVCGGAGVKFGTLKVFPTAGGGPAIMEPVFGNPPSALAVADVEKEERLFVIEGAVVTAASVP